jgi:hypothetical protein
MAVFNTLSGVLILIADIVIYALLVGLVKDQGGWFVVSITLVWLSILIGVSAVTEGLGELLWGKNGVLILPQSFMNILPAAVLLYGPVSDLIKYEVVSGIPAYASFFFLLLVRIVSLMYTSKLPSDGGTVQEIWCTLPGFEWLENPFFPSSVFTTWTITVYYMCWTLFTDSNKKSMVLAGGFTAIALSFAQFAFGRCSSYYMSLGGQGMWANLLVSSALGTIMGSSLYGAFWTNASKNPFYGNPYSNAGTSGVTKSQVSATNPVPMTTEAPSGEEQTFVAELYKNGQLVTEDISK